MTKEKVFVKDESDIRKLNYMQPFEYTCKKCGTVCNIKGFRNNCINNYLELLCPSCMKIKRYGYVSPFANKEIMDSIKAHNLETLGVEFPLQSQKIHDTISENNLKRVGNKCTLHDGGECEAKAKSTFNEKYGVDHPLQNKDIYNATRETFRNKTGVTYSWEDKETYAKAINTIKDEFGVDNVMKLQEFVEKGQETTNKKFGQRNIANADMSTMNEEQIKNFIEMRNEMSEKFGVQLDDCTTYQECMSKIRASHYDEWDDRSIQLHLNKYGMWFSQTEEFKQDRLNNPEKYRRKTCLSICNLSFDSIPEFCVYVCCVSNGIPIYRNEMIYGFNYIDPDTGYNRIAYPDFMINGKWVEIKGAHFFDENNNLINPYDETKNKLSNAKQKCLLENGVLIIRDDDPWVKMCISYVFNMYNPNFIPQHMLMRDINESYGLNPFNIDKNSEFQDQNNIGLTPFNMIQGEDYQYLNTINEIPFNKFN